MDSIFVKNIPSSWKRLVARMYQSVLDAQPRQNISGIIIMSISVLVDGKGEVIQFTPPKCEALEPKHDSEKLLRLLTRTD